MVIPNASACALWNAGEGKIVLYQRATVTPTRNPPARGGLRPQSTWDGETFSASGVNREGEGRRRRDYVAGPDREAHGIDQVHGLLGDAPAVREGDDSDEDRPRTDACIDESQQRN